MTRIAVKVFSRARRAYALYQTVKARQRSFAIGSLITVAFNGLSILVSAATSILVARALGPQELGYLILFITGTITIALFADVMGICYSNAYLVASGNHHFDAATVKGTVLGYGVIVGLVTGSVFGLMSPVRLLIFRGFDELTWGVLIGINILGLTLLNQIRGLFLGHSNFIGLGALGLFQALLYSILALGATYIWDWQTGVQVAMMHVVATWLCLIGAVLSFFYRGVANPSLSYMKACAKVGWRAALINWLSFLHTRIDQYLVNMFLGPVALGLYGVAVSVGELLTRIPGMLGNVLFPLVASNHNRPDAVKGTLKRTCIVVTTIGIFALILAPLASNVIAVLYGDEFSESAAALRFLLPAIVFLSGLLLVNNHLAGLGYPTILIASMLIGLGGNVLLNSWLLPRVGVVGASIASSVTYGIQFLIVLGYLVRSLKTRA